MNARIRRILNMAGLLVGMIALVAWPLVLLAQGQGDAAAPPSELDALAPAAIPFVLFAVKWFVKNVIPDALIVEIRDHVIPFLAPLLGVGLKMLESGQVDWSQGAMIGLAGVGIHQMLKQSGIHGALFDR